MRFVLPYFLHKSEGGVIVGRVTGESLQRIGWWDRHNIAVTVDYATNKIVRLADYERGFVFREKDGAFVPDRSFSPSLTNGVVATPLRIWGASATHARTYVFTSTHQITIEGWEVFAPPISVLRNGGITVMGRYYPPLEKPIFVPGRVNEDGTYLIVMEAGTVSNYAAPQMQWSRERLAEGTCIVDVCTPQAILFSATFLPPRHYLPGVIATHDNNIVVVCLPVRCQRYSRHVFLVWRCPVPYPIWACDIRSVPKNVFISKKYLYLSVFGGEWTNGCYVWQIDGEEVRYATHLGSVPEDEVYFIKRCDELSRQIREGRRLFPAEDEFSPLWASTLVSMDREYVQECANRSWIPQIGEVEFSPPDGRLRLPPMITGQVEISN